MVVPWRAMYRTVHFFSSLFILALPPSPNHPVLHHSSFLSLRLRLRGGCTRVRTRAPSSSFSSHPLSSATAHSCFSLFSAFTSSSSTDVYLSILLSNLRSLFGPRSHSGGRDPPALFLQPVPLLLLFAISFPADCTVFFLRGRLENAAELRRAQSCG